MYYKHALFLELLIKDTMYTKLKLTLGTVNYYNLMHLGLRNFKSDKFSVHVHVYNCTLTLYSDG